ncbi:DUF896 domain-containing protein [Lactobacillus sp. DCY120]|uniref:UPF0291 protein HU830_07580 n=1 Tax=Bombilactobacillus apium TaxID=2675299 RepID=A0A850R1L5_9LACO|nr:DUF896 domain-containing protein [Bombilactobacillus apium]NVY97009.1 DUF896 domain-containing protein [Bombilactobacillus apium]
MVTADNDLEHSKLIKRINELARLKKQRELTPEEQAEQQDLRQRYLFLFRQGLRQRIEHTKLYDQQGKEITSAQVRKIQKKQGWRPD